MSKKVRAISLFSGGLDSICATRLVMEQGIDVIAVRFITPFFGYELLADPERYYQKIQKKYGITVRLVDLSADYLDMLREPVHGFGKYFNPCIDCKIFMLERARMLLDEMDASFLISGEVLGQRPMSQRRDALQVIERDSQTRGLLLRPLSAKLMKETEMELRGLVDREKLLDFSGRGRSRQIALAKSMQISDFPNAAGGCILADPILSRRIARIYSGDFVVSRKMFNVNDILLLLIGRQYRLPGGGWLILGRDEKENRRIEQLREAGDIWFDIEERPGPSALLRRPCYSSAALKKADICRAAGLVSRYAKKKAGTISAGTVVIEDAEKRYQLYAEPERDKQFRSWVIG